MINLRELIKFSDWLENSLSSCQKKLCNKIKNLTQKLWDSHFIKNELKISFFEKIHHVALNENEFKIVNNLSVDNDSNDSNSDNFMSAASFTCFISLITVFNVIVY